MVHGDTGTGISPTLNRQSASLNKFEQPIWSFCFISVDSPPLKLCHIAYVQNQSDEKSNEPEILGLGRPFILGYFDVKIVPTSGAWIPDPRLKIGH